LGISSGSSKTPVLAGNTVYLGAVTAVDADTGGVKWTFDGKNQYPIVSVAIANGYVFVGSTRTDTTLDSSNGRIYVLKADTGELVYQYFAGECHNDWYAIDPSPSIAEGSVVLNMSTYMLFCLSPPERSPLLGVSVDKNKINAYDNETGSVTLTFNLDATGTVTADVVNSQGTTVYHLAENQTLGKGAHSLAWHGLIYFPEMADPVLKDEFDDKCILVAPDGDYKLLITVKSAAGKSYTGSATVQVEAQT
ncbi:MAG: outer membrane protein assembly factor BamB family protein, partial [Candidatus Aquicultor sp.]